MPQLLCCVLTAAVLAAVAAAADDTDKSAFTLFNPTPSEHLRELSVDGPAKTASPYTVDAGHFQLEMNLVSYPTTGALRAARDGGSTSGASPP